MDKIVPFFIILKDAAISVGRWIQAHNGFVSAVATVVIAAFTVTLWLANRKLWKATIGLLQVSHEHSRHMEKSLAIAQESANAAKKSAEVAEDTLQITQMAYVDITDHQLSRPLSIGVNPQIVYEITNHGNTVAHITEVVNIVDIVNEFSLDPDYTKCKVVSKNLPIRRNSTVHKFATMDRPINMNGIISIYNGTQFLGFWGTITYYDIFQKSVTIGFGVKYRPHANLFAFIDGYNYIKEHEEKEQS